MANKVIHWYQVLSPFVLIGLMLTATCAAWFHLKHLYDIEELRGAAGRVSGALVAIESGQRGYLITGSVEYLDEYRYNRKILTHRMDLLCRLLAKQKVNPQACNQLNTLLKDKLAEMEETVQDAETGHQDKAVAIVKTDRGLALTRQIGRILEGIRPNYDDDPATCIVQ